MLLTTSRVDSHVDSQTDKIQVVEKTNSSVMFFGVETYTYFRLCLFFSSNSEDVPALFSMLMQEYLFSPASIIR